MKKLILRNPGAKIGSLVLAIILWFHIKKMEETPSRSNPQETHYNGTGAR
jgi:hypothetical protein